jgi:hypothetical protein
VTGPHFYALWGRVSKIVRMSPFGRLMRRPELALESAGTSVSSEYSKVDFMTKSCEMVMYPGSEVSAFIKADSVEITIPMSRVKLVTKPCILTFTNRSADTNQARTGIDSVTNRCNRSPASLGEIMLSLMADELSQTESRFWCKRLGFKVQRRKLYFFSSDGQGIIQKSGYAVLIYRKIKNRFRKSLKRRQPSRVSRR